MTPEDHQRKIATNTLKMSKAGAKIAGGMTHQEAVRFLISEGGMTPLQVESRLFAAGHPREDVRHWMDGK